MTKQLLLTAGTVLALSLASQAAHAQAGGPLNNEKWLCTEKNGAAPTEYVLENGELIALPLRAPRYRVLDNTQYGLVAADYSADLDIGFVNVYIATVMIDRVNGNYIATSSNSSGVPTARSGECHLNRMPGPSAQK
jgi:hypothetical protein